MVLFVFAFPNEGRCIRASGQTVAGLFPVAVVESADHSFVFVFYLVCSVPRPSPTFLTIASQKGAGQLGLFP